MNERESLDATFEAAKNGDQAAWNLLVERFIPLVMSIARRFRLNSEDAADLNQTLWLRLVEHLGQIREPNALPGWIVTTSKNEALRLLKARNRTIAVDPQGGFGLDEADGPELDEDLLREERRQALRDGLSQLRPKSRDLLLLLIADPPLSYEEIGARLGMPVGSIGPTRARILGELRKTPAMRTFLNTHDTAQGR